MATIAPSPSGAAITYQAATAGAGDKYVNSGREKLHIRNGSGAPITAHVPKQALCSFGQSHATDASDDIVIPAGEDRLVAALDPARYNDGTGFAHVTYSAVASVTVGLIV